MNAQVPSERTRLTLWWFPVAVLIIGATLTAIAAVAFAASSDARARMRFEGAVIDAQEDVGARLDAYVALLRGGSALFAVRSNVTRMEWHAFVDRLRLPEYYPGVQGIGFSSRMKADEVDSWIDRIRKDGATNFAIRPTGIRPEYHAIIFLEPLDQRNQAAIGYDMFSETTRRNAMERAWMTGNAAASGKVRLVQEIEGPEQAGFLIYLPIYQGGASPRGLEDRQDSLVGFVYSPFRADDFFAGIFGTFNPLQIALEVFDGSERKTAARLHISPSATQLRAESHRPRFEAIRTLEVAGGKWTLVYSSTKAFEETTFRWLTPMIAAVGLILTLVLFQFACKELRARTAVERSAAELEQKVNERTSQLSQTVTELEAFSYSISHDLRAPLRAIQGFSQILIGEVDGHGNLRPEAREYLKRITNAAARMDRLIQDVLNYSQVARSELTMGRVEMNPLVHEIIDSYPMLQPPAAKIEFVGTLPAVTGNEALLTQCVSNLLGNAVKFVAPGVEPHVRIWADSKSGSDYVRIYFRDNGLGIEREDQEKIFEIFQRLHRHYDGTGIGLSIVKKSVERMGGKVGLESEPGKGSTFWLDLKRAAQP